jgi:hypothetical protein
MLGRREIMPPGRVQVPQRSPTMTGSHNTKQKENGGAPKKICEDKYSGEHKTKREFYEGAAHRVRHKIPIIHRVKIGYEGSQ